MEIGISILKILGTFVFFTILLLLALTVVRSTIRAVQESREHANEKKPSKSIPWEKVGCYANPLIGMSIWTIFVFTVMLLSPEYWKIWWYDKALFWLSTIIVLVVFLSVQKSRKTTMRFATFLIVVGVLIIGSTYVGRLEDNGLISLSSFKKTADATSAQVTQRKTVSNPPDAVINVPYGGTTYHFPHLARKAIWLPECLGHGYIITQLQTMECGPGINYDPSTLEGHHTWVKFRPAVGESALQVVIRYQYL